MWSWWTSVVSQLQMRPCRAPSIDPGLGQPGFLDRGILDLSAWSWDDFLRAVTRTSIPNLAVSTEAGYG